MNTYDLLPTLAVNWIPFSAVFKDAHVLTNTEMSLLLNMAIVKKRERNPHFEMPAVMKKTKDYVDKFGQGRNEESAREIRR